MKVEDLYLIQKVIVFFNTETYYFPNASYNQKQNFIEVNYEVKVYTGDKRGAGTGNFLNYTNYC